MTASIPPVGPTSTGSGELAGGDVQAMPPRPKARRRGNRHDQRTPLPGDPGFTPPSLTADILRELLRPDPHAACPDAGCGPDCPARLYPTTTTEGE